jgi:hypothetical protein
LLQCIDPGLHRSISANIHLLLKQTCKTQLKYLFCVAVGTKGLTSVHAVAAEMVVVAAENWLATKVSAAITTLSAPLPSPQPPPRFLLLSRLAIFINATVTDTIAISVTFFS